MAKNANGIFKTLYCKNDDGSINQWDIAVTSNPLVEGVITTKYGRVGGAIQTTVDVVKEGKNIGKKNATTAFEQAIKEAEAKWTKQKKGGYVESLKDAANGKVDAIIEGGIDPMLAQKFRDHAAKVIYPAFVQPKLDGIRCIAILKNGKCTLWSRTRKQITGVPHVAIHIERTFAGKGDVILDGELYNHDFRDNFEEIVSYVRQQKPKAGHEVVQYHIYDLVEYGLGFSQRTFKLTQLIPANHSTLKLVETKLVSSKGEVEEYLAACLEEGWEGCMVRNAEGTYQNKRSYNLQKVKEFDDDEFAIVGVEEGRGKMAGKAIFVCKTKSGKEFTAKMKGKIDALAKYLKNDKLWKGKKLTVRYQGFTNGNVPRFPVGIIVRDYE